MIQNSFDAKRLIADIHNDILKSLEKSDHELKRQVIDLLRDLFEENNYIITYEYSDGIEFEARQGFQGGSPVNISSKMEFRWNYTDVDDYPYRKGWNITAIISRYESSKTYEIYRSYMIYWSDSLKKGQRISPLYNSFKRK